MASAGDSRIAARTATQAPSSAAVASAEQGDRYELDRGRNCRSGRRRDAAVRSHDERAEPRSAERPRQRTCGISTTTTSVR